MLNINVIFRRRFVFRFNIPAAREHVICCLVFYKVPISSGSDLQQRSKFGKNTASPRTIRKGGRYAIFAITRRTNCTGMGPMG